MRRLAEADPDFVYLPGLDGACLYTPDEYQPGCIFGQAFINLGDPVDPECDRVLTSIAQVLDRKGIEATPAQRAWCVDVQSLQDSEGAWGEAVRQADERFVP